MGMYFRFNLSAGMSYRGAFLIQVLGMMLNNSAFIVFWLILFEKIGGNLKGYDFYDIMFLWSLAATGVGMAAVFMGNAHQISRIIYSGELDVYLLQPKPIALNLVSSRMMVAAWGDIIFGLLLFFFTQAIRLDSILLFLLFSILVALVFTAMRVLYHSLTFYLGNAETFAGFASEMLLSFSLYPGSIFKGPAVWILHSLVPAAFVAYLPVRLIKHFNFGLFAVLIAADLAFVAIGMLTFYRGLRVYESGNRIGTRI